VAVKSLDIDDADSCLLLSVQLRSALIALSFLLASWLARIHLPSQNCRTFFSRP
jgi:hypothetical protein